jgi:hypothetical protein
MTRRIEVSNTTRGPLAVALYPAAATIDDGYFVGAAGSTANDLSSWCSVLPTAVELPSGGTRVITVTITVPSDAPLGERYAAVWAEIRSGPESGIVQINRVGIRLYVSVGDGTAPVMDFAIQSVTAERTPSGLPKVVAIVLNTGDRALDMTGSLQLLNGPGGLSAGPFAATPGSTLAIGATGTVVVELDARVPDGPWDAQLTMRSGLLERSAKSSITFPRSDSASPQPVSPAWLAWLSFAFAAIICLLALALIVGLWRKRRGSEERSQR